ncbi:hypothetical protein SNOG_04200 [Parastagonospora nodorum SN15]|uniref:Uncharacterized protein n=1 Tax=Phaeosphaeria nodorum (strain SN15 / ATCC MYA-4574 / FGSC 10173) TaxID=321614 RepID=Q0UVL4_PHANO|nr:hypothetical protein SNOG_04200 [Parastagonospora nodorum SN15]EAT87960.1 hypothetical protein SNOG_04200 [Parastagonospora nodorum SN15]
MIARTNRLVASSYPYDNASYSLADENCSYYNVSLMLGQIAFKSCAAIV